MPKTELISASHLHEALNGLTYAETKRLASDAGVPFTTLWKLRTGETQNPRLETVTRLMAAGLAVVRKPARKVAA